MERILILGGTRGLGREIAIEALNMGVQPIIIGRSAAEAREDPKLSGAKCIVADLTRPQEFDAVLNEIWREPENLPSQIFWVAGEYHRGPLTKMGDKLERLMRLYFYGPVSFLAKYHERVCGVDEKVAKAYDLIVIGSVLAYKIGKPQAVFCGLQAAKVHFARSFAFELSRDLPGAITLIVNPWAMKTDFFKGEKGIKTDTFMDPKEVAKIIYKELNDLPGAKYFDPSEVSKGTPPVELNLLRTSDGSIEIRRGPQTPEY